MTWTMLDTFSGIGGFSLAAAWTGRIRTVQFVEIDPWCRRVLAKHWPGVPIHDDIRTFENPNDSFWSVADTEVRPRGDVADADGGSGRFKLELHPSGQSRGDCRLDLLTGGFPCQPFSAAGKRQGASDDRYLWPELARVIRATQPRYCLLENVPGIIGLEGGLDRVLADLGASGYATGTVVIPAAAVGAYHRRDRVWIVAHAERADSNRTIGDGYTAGSDGLADGGDVPDPPLRGLRRGSASGEPGLAAQSGEDAPNGPSDIRRASGDGGRESFDGRGRGQSSNGHETLGGLGDAPDGLSGRLAQPRRKAPVRVPRAVQQARYREVLRRTLVQNAGGDGIGESLAARFPLAAPITFGPDWEAGVPRVTQHEADRVNKLKTLGNAIVPAVAYELMLMLLAVDDIPANGAEVGDRNDS